MVVQPSEFTKTHRYPQKKETTEGTWDQQGGRHKEPAANSRADLVAFPGGGRAHLARPLPREELALGSRTKAQGRPRPLVGDPDLCGGHLALATQHMAEPLFELRAPSWPEMLPLPKGQPQPLEHTKTSRRTCSMGVGVGGIVSNREPSRLQHGPCFGTPLVPTIQGLL